MSCVLEILSLHELNVRKDYLLKQINKIDLEIQKRNIIESLKIEDDIITEKQNESFKIKINITKNITKNNNNDSKNYVMASENLYDFSENKSAKDIKKIKIKITPKSNTT
jgi:hypothetical protein